MAFAGRFPTLQLSSATARRGVRRAVSAALGAALVPAMVLAVLPPGSAGADTLGGDQAQANQLGARIAAGASRVRQLTEQLDQAQLEAASTSARLAAVTSRLQRTSRLLRINRATLQRQAVPAYIQGGRTAPISGSGRRPGDLTLNQEYLEVASGNLASTDDQLHALEADLHAEEGALRDAQKRSRQAVRDVASLQQRALATAEQEQATLDQLHGRMAQLVASAVAARAPQGAAARAPQGLPVNGGLVSVVTAAGHGIDRAAPASSPSPPARQALSPSAPVSSSPAPAPSAGAGGVWAQLRQCESSGNYAENTGNGYYGAYQFSQSTWTGLGLPGRPDLEPPAMQDQAARTLEAQAGWGQWPACAAALGLI